MATQLPIDDDAVSLDADEIQGPVNLPQPTSTFNPSTGPTSAFRTARPPSTTSPALAQLNSKWAKIIDEKFNILEPPNKHSTTIAFEDAIGATIVELADFWFCQGSPYDHVCLARSNWRHFGPSQNVGKFYTRAEFHLLLYAYTLKRTSAIGIMLSEEYELLDDGLSATDKAFAVIVEALVHNYDDMLPYIVDWPERGRIRTVMIDHPRLLRAMEIVMELPMRFRVKAMDSYAIGKDRDKEEEAVFFRFKDVEGKGWETEMEVVGKKDAGLICEGKKYEI